MSKNEDSNANVVSARRIAQLLYEKGWNKSQLARELGLSVQAVQHWSKGNSRPSGANLTKLSEVSGKPEYWFFQSDDEISPAVQKKSKTAISDEFGELDEDQRRLLRVFAEFPPLERRNMLAAFEMRLQELKEYFDRVVRNSQDRKDE